MRRRYCGTMRTFAQLSSVRRAAGVINWAPPISGRNRLTRVPGGLLSLAIATAFCLPAATVQAAPVQAAPMRAAAVRAAATKAARTVPVPSYTYIHDPSMAKEGKTWYLFSTGDPNGGVNNGNIQIRESANLRSWRLVGTVFQNIPAWITNDLGTPIPNLWAPDISYFNGKWHLYYAASVFGVNTSIIALATNATLDPKSPHYHWDNDGKVFSSDAADNYNAIDPALVTGIGGNKWLLFGSFWSGIKLMKLDPATGKPASAHPTLYSLSEAPSPDAEEGSYIVPHGGYYYLFVSAGDCCKGIGSSYQIIVGKSKQITGPYVDPNGTAMTDGGGMEFLGSSEGMIGPGSLSVYQGANGDLIDYHYYDAWDQGNPWVQVRHIYWAAGWPVTGPPLVPVPGSPLAAAS